MALNHFCLDIDDLWSGNIDSIDWSRLKSCRDFSVAEKVIMSQVLSRKTGMTIGRLMDLVKVGEYVEV